MAEAYSVSAALTIESNVTTVVAELTRGFTTVNQLIKETQSTLREFQEGLQTLSSGGRGIQALVRSTRRLSEMRLGDLLTDMRSFLSVSQEIQAAQGAIARSAQETARAWRQASAAGMRGGGGRGGGGGGMAPPEDPTGAWNPQSRTDYPNAAAENANRDTQYRYMRGLADRENQDRDLRARQARAVAAQAQRDADREYRDDRAHAEHENRDRTTRAREGERRRGDMVDGGFGLGILGSGASALLENAFNAQAQVQRQTILAQSDTRVTGAVMQQVNAQIQALQKQYPTLTQAEGIKLFRENMGIFGNSDEALATLGSTARLQTLYQLTGIQGGGTGGNETQAANKAGDAMQAFIDPTTHKIDSGLYQQYMDMQARSVLAGGGLIDARSWLAFARTGRTGAIGLDHDALEYTQALLEISPGRTGTAINSAFQVLGAGALRMGKKDRAAWQHAGLTDRSGAIVQQDLYQKDPYQWVWKVLLPQLQKQGISDRQGILRWLSEHGERQTVSGVLADIATGQAPIENTKARIDAQNPNAVDQLTNSDVGKMEALQTAETNFLVSLGKFLEGPGVAMLTQFTAALTKITDWANANTTAADIIVKAGLGLTAFSVAAGNLANIIFIGAPIVRGFGALAKTLRAFGTGGEAETALLKLGGTGAGSLLGLAAPLVAVAAAVALVASQADRINKFVQSHLPSWAREPAGTYGPDGKLATPVNPNPLHGLLPPGNGGSAPNGVPHSGAAFGPQIHAESFIAPSQPVFHIQNIVYLDGEQINSAVQTRMARRARQPPTSRGDLDPQSMLTYPT